MREKERVREEEDDLLEPYIDCDLVCTLCDMSCQPNSRYHQKLLSEQGLRDHIALRCDRASYGDW